MILADIMKRWHILKGEKTVLCTGTDEHGMKIQQAASKAKIPPKEFCDQTAETFKALAQRVEMTNDRFIRTTDNDHREAVQHFWRILNERGYIYESKHEGWYCVSDETFYPESAIEKRLDPYTGRTFMASQETGKEVEWTSEVNYHFRLSAMKDRLLEFYEKNPEFVEPASRMKDVVSWVSEGLEDLSVSRPVERLTWGIPVPDDPSQTIYVWLDALINYITYAGYPWAPGKEKLGGWPADVQVIGKDIVRFHCIYWPAFLLALNLEPPKQVLTHAHWTLDKQKMSKSSGNSVNPFFAIDRFGLDAMRYYLAHDGGIAQDADYANQFIVERYKKGLSGGIGNLLSRITKPKIWNVREAVDVAVSGNLISPDPATLSQIEIITNLRDVVNTKMDKLDSRGALHAIMEVIYETNKYLHNSAPWISARSDDPLDQRYVPRTIFHCAEAVRVAGILLQPYIPNKASELLDVLGVDKSRRGYDFALFRADDSYGVPIKSPGNSRNAWESLFPPLSVED
ncbi:hypothetical protein B7463_g1695, partial [Scytalidium lignicola]